MRTQDIASDLAKKFNDQACTHFGAESQSFLRKLPRNGEEKNILVEKYLEGKYEKFNNNMGHVHDDVKHLVDRMGDLGLGGNSKKGFDDGLGAIEEGSEDESSDEEDSSDEEEQEVFDSKEVMPDEGNYGDLQDEYFPQAFSHFTYEKSKKVLMVVDLQGVFTIKEDGTKLYELTDPVIHKRRIKRNHFMKEWNFGRTKGMKAFFETHKCTDAFRLLGLTEVDPQDVCKSRGDVGSNYNFWRRQASGGIGGH